MAASQDGLLVDVITVVLTVALVLAAVYVIVGLALLPVWAVGAVLDVGALRRIGGSWWAMPRLALEAWERLTAQRDGSRWERLDPAPATDPGERADWAHSLGVLALWALAIVGGFALVIEGQDAIVEPLAGGSAGEVFVVALVALTAAGAASAWVLSRHYRFDRRPPAFRFALASAVILGVVSYLAIVELSNDHRLVEDYCSFGSVSERQLETCRTHVTANRVRSIDTPAARFALDGSSDAACGAGAGPFCPRVRNRRYLEEQQPPAGQ
jgi:hypothetical protein